MSPTRPVSDPAGGSNSLVLVVDDDRSMRVSLAALFRSVGLNTELFDSAAALLKRKPPDVESCLVLDVRLPGESGLEIQAQLTRLYREIPIVFVTAHGDIPMSVQAMKAGAVDFLTKPFRDQDMLDAVGRALARDRARRRATKEAAALYARFERLTAREREVMTYVAAGRLNKQIAAELGISEITVKLHRGNVMKKMEARSVADLVRMAEALQTHRIAQPP